MARTYETDSGNQERVRPSTPGGVAPSQTATSDPNQGTSPSTGTTGNPIPGADVYLGRENQANAAYEKAKSQLLAQRNTLYHSYGLDDTGNVDPNAQYGEYQMLLGSQGAALDSARDDSAGRGIAGSGLGNQAESGLRFQQGYDQQQFKNRVDQAGVDYAGGLTDAENTRSNAYIDAENEQLQTSLLNQLFNPVSATEPGSNVTPPPSEATRTSQAATAKKLLTQQLATLSAKKVTANKTGATVQKGRGVISIH